MFSLLIRRSLKEVKDHRKGIKGGEGGTCTKGFLSAKKNAMQLAFLHERPQAEEEKRRRGREKAKKGGGSQRERGRS